MKSERKAKKYAVALMSVARGMDAIDAVHNSMQTVSHLLRKDPTFRSFFQTRRIPAQEKSAILERVVAEAVHPIVSEFFGVLAAAREQHLFHQAAHSFDLLRQQELNLVLITATFPEEPLNEENERVVGALSKITKRCVEFVSTTDPEMIGGIRLRMGNDFLDGSIKGNLEKLKRQLI